MRAERSFPSLTVSKKGSNSIKNGHPWVYDNDILSDTGTLENGSIVDVVTEKGRYLGSGLVSSESRIRVRLLSGNANDCYDESFWRRRIEYAWHYRKAVMPDDLSCCRIVFGEADGLPGLTVDRYEDVLVTQCMSYGMEKRKDFLYRLLLDVLAADGQIIRGIYERNDSNLRLKEALKKEKGWYSLPGESLPLSTVVRISENGILYDVDVENGQKTGFFLDQKYNRKAVAALARGKRVLDCFTHTGSFALNAAKGDAAHVTAVDSSELALKMASSHANLNGFTERMDFIQADVFDILPELAKRKPEPYDFVILDPPAFTKSRKTIHNAWTGYREINFRAMKLLPRGGLLATASCSHFMDAELFEEMLRDAAQEAGVQLRQIAVRQQAPDHPILWNVPETNYLKFYLLQVV